MAEALLNPLKSVKQCANCAIFNWKQPTDSSTLKRCTRCQLYWYCSEVCQKEHWHNAHKHHCKYLALEKVLPNSKHNDATCLVCKEESKAGKKNVSKPTNPVLPCYISTANKSSWVKYQQMFGPGGVPQYSFEEITAISLPEMTGIYHSKLDATLAIMMRILLKIKMTNNIIWKTNKPSVLDMYRILRESRLYEWHRQLAAKPGVESMNEVNRCFLDLDAASKSIDDMFLSDPEIDPLMPWNTFKILMSFCFDSLSMKGVLIYDNLDSANDVCNKFEKIRMNHGTFHKLWENVLILLKMGMVPLATIVKALCDENPARKCYECGTQIIVQDVTTLRGTLAFIPDIPVLMFGKGVIFALCGKASCFHSLERGPYKRIREKLRGLYVKLLIEYSGEFCDYCDGINGEMMSHRCAKCKTKVYCGIECLNKDKVHLMLCQEGGTRKQKPSSSGRKERSKMRFEEILSAEEVPTAVKLRFQQLSN